MGDLDKVAVVQEDYRGLLRAKPGAGGPTLEEETIFNSVEKYGEDPIVNLSVILQYIFKWPEQYGHLKTVQDAVAILDHLDTLGMEVRFKNGITTSKE